MTENFLLQNPLQLFDDFKEIPDLAFEDESSREELVSVINSVINSEDYIRVLVNLYHDNPEEIRNKMNDFKKELNKANSGQYRDKRAEIVKYFMDKTINTLEEIILYDGAFKNIPIKVMKVDEDAKLPFYSDGGDACMDICSNKEMTIAPHTTEVVPSGIKAIVPGGYELQVRPRSGLSRKTGIRVANTPGTIDSGYRHEIGVILENTSDTPFEIHKYDRIAQLRLAEVPHIIWDEISEEEYDKYTTNRGEGFGSSGIATNG